MMEDYYQQSMRALQLAGMSDRHSSTIHAPYENWSISTRKRRI